MLTRFVCLCIFPVVKALLKREVVEAAKAGLRLLIKKAAEEAAKAGLRALFKARRNIIMVIKNQSPWKWEPFSVFFINGIAVVPLPFQVWPGKEK